ncbi:hypothetical protein [Hahella ganghwensis]|uniref:hypothetical protein n=1 Tax=Hahella ganghwensis TaxID=286420 RepID=UPI00036B26B5|nr:hypothetical protein [Hahella ganghwensis]
MIKRWGLAILISISLAITLTAGLVYHYLSLLPDLVKPVKIAEAYALTDGGSLFVTFIAKDGRKIYIGIRGDLYSARKDFPLIYMRHPELIPYIYSPAPGSDSEKEYLDFLASWIHENVDQHLIKKIKRGEIEEFDLEQLQFVVVYEIYSLLLARN